VPQIAISPRLKKSRENRCILLVRFKEKADFRGGGMNYLFRIIGPLSSDRQKIKGASGNE
jgi:hypothetical protein